MLRLKPVPLLKAKPRHCRAPLDERGPDGLVMFCGRPTVRREINGEMRKYSWCANHYQRFHYRAVIGRDR
ncbi:MAG TPA: hypothetical protein VK603_06510 [Candidatus Saccharimonadales bacterium]|nr:hypothetical protein [Candidatus Saccharimonadales bacterium]